MSTSRSIGIIAGNGVYPETFVRAARIREPGTRIVVVAFEGETRPDLEPQVDSLKWLRVGQLSKLIRFFVKEGVEEAVMMGQISPENLFSLRPDLRILMMLARVKKRNAETLFGAIAEELAKDGIILLPATTFLEDHLPGTGHVTGPASGPAPSKTSATVLTSRKKPAPSTSANPSLSDMEPSSPSRPSKEPTPVYGEAVIWAKTGTPSL